MSLLCTSFVPAGASVMCETSEQQQQQQQPFQQPSSQSVTEAGAETLRQQQVCITVALLCLPGLQIV